jgi:tRNA nucleotidyltransferase (CCA-adding enzyme)
MNKIVPVLHLVRHHVKGAFDKENFEVVSEKVDKYGQKQLEVISEFLKREFSMTEGTIGPQIQNENQSH